MIKWLKILLTGFLVSCFYFPVVYKFFPIANTKNLMAAFGYLCFFVVMIKKGEFSFHKGFPILLLLAGFVSIMALLAINVNQTPDTTYVTYIRSAIIWIGGAYAVCSLIYLTHKRVTVPLVINYLAWVCVFQCLIALLNEFIPAFRTFIDATVEQGQGMLQDLGRMYGLGASLDVGGSRFAATLVAISFLLVQKGEDREYISQFLLVFAFCFITVVGNMIARTTLVGVGVGLVYLIMAEIRNISLRRHDDDYHSSLFSWILVLAVAIPVCSFFYTASDQFNQMMRFGFEGFFNFIEEGHWSTASTSTLETMYVWPDNLKTWMIGDGYFGNQRYDPNYIGTATRGGFYMGTDVGYCRYIFYFGIPGLIAISAVMIYAGVIASEDFPKYAHVFFMGVLCNFIIWLKVSTDLFPFLSLFAALAFLTSDLEYIEKMKEEEQKEEEKNDVPVPE